MSGVRQFHSFDELQDYVREVLCTSSGLALETPLVETTLMQRGEACGIEYTIVGPRAVRMSAIWEAKKSRILFYNQQLQRFKIDEVTGLPLETIADRERTSTQLRSSWRGK